MKVPIRKKNFTALSICLSIVLATVLQIVRFNIEMNRGGALSQAASTGNDSELEGLLRRGYDPNAAVYKGGKPLYWASQNGHTSSIKLLIRYRVDLHNSEGVRALIAAIQMGHWDVVALLIRSGVSPVDRGPYGENAIQATERIGKQEIVKNIIANTATLRNR